MVIEIVIILIGQWFGSILTLSGWGAIGVERHTSAPVLNEVLSNVCPLSCQIVNAGDKVNIIDTMVTIIIWYLTIAVAIRGFPMLLIDYTI